MPTSLVHNLDKIMRRIDADMHKRGAELDNENLGMMGSKVITQLAQIAPAPTQSLVSTMGRDPSQMTRILKQLHEKDVITRQPSSTDKRVIILDLTDKGRDYVERLYDAFEEIVEDVLGPLTEDEKKTLSELTAKCLR